jgi:hypothetical protein
MIAASLSLVHQRRAGSLVPIADNRGNWWPIIRGGVARW